MPVPCLAPRSSHQSSATGKEQGQTQTAPHGNVSSTARLGLLPCRTTVPACWFAWGGDISLQNVPCRETQASGKGGGNKENQTRPEQLALARGEQR